MRVSTILLLILTGVSSVLGGFDSDSKSNVAMYWGQNSLGTAKSQHRLSHYCNNTNVDIILLAFLVQLHGLGGQPVLNFANQIDDKKCKLFQGTNLAECPELDADIQECQKKHGKTILLSIGGATYTEGGFVTPQLAITSARKIWHMFGPPRANTLRPFGTASVDGFDFDIEAGSQHLVSFANELRRLMDYSNKNDQSQKGRQFYLSAAPQCPFPDAYTQAILSNVSLDMVFVQFYNNWCGVNGFVSGAAVQPSFSFVTWDSWARKEAVKTNVSIFLGVSGGQTAAGSGYLSSSALEPVFAYLVKFERFSGTMVWDASQTWANGEFIGKVKKYMQSL